MVNIVENYLANGWVSITLDSRFGGVRKQKRLPGLYYKKNPQTALEREDKKEKKIMVQLIKAKMESDALYSDFMLERGYDLSMNFFDYAATLISKAPPSDKRHYRAVINKLKGWYGKDNLPFSLITTPMMQEFKRFLDNDRNGITAYNYFKKLKRMFKQALADKHFKVNPIEAVVNRRAESAKKDTLTIEEIKKLASTPCCNNDVKQAFLFSCLTGLRYCDVKELTWANIDIDGLNFRQSKTKRHLNLKLSTDSIRLIGEPQDKGQKIFLLPSYTSCLKNIKVWVKDACVQKHVSLHVGRHSFGTLLAQNNVSPLIIQKLLGHSKLEQTMTYVRAADEQQLSALNQIPSIFNF